MSPSIADHKIEDKQKKSRGVLWMLGSFAICPCHLPITLGLLTTVLGGTAVGALVREHIVLAGAIIVTVWAFAMWRGLRLLRDRSACRIRSSKRTGLQAVGDFLGFPKP
jgi:hypothetical protein